LDARFPLRRSARLDSLSSVPIPEIIPQPEHSYESRILVAN
jgi:hypothetical protein